jgi:hypothetical protein
MQKTFDISLARLSEHVDRCGYCHGEIANIGVKYR